MERRAHKEKDVFLASIGQKDTKALRTMMTLYGVGWRLLRAGVGSSGERMQQQGVERETGLQLGLGSDGAK